jgi:hypothetical protein
MSHLPGILTLTGCQLVNAGQIMKHRTAQRLGLKPGSIASVAIARADLELEMGPIPIKTI